MDPNPHYPYKPDFWRDVLDDFLADQGPNWDSKTYNYYRARLRPFLAYLVSRRIRSPADITLRDLKRFLSDQRQAGLAWSTRNGTHTALSQFFRWLRRLRLIERDLFNDPESEISRPEKPQQAKELVPHRAVSAMIRAAAADPSPYGRRDEAIMRLLLNTGLRRNELVSLRVADYDPEERKLQIRKGGKRGNIRPVFIHRATARAIDRWLEVRPDTNDPALFTTLRGHKEGRFTKMNPNRVNAILIKWRKAARLPEWTVVNPHSWRHRFGTDFSAAGGDALVLQPLMGHSDIRITREYVTHNEETLKRMADLFSPGRDIGDGSEGEL